MIVISPTTDSTSADFDLTGSTGEATFSVDGTLGEGEEIVFNTINSDNSVLPIIEGGVAKKLTSTNTVATTRSHLPLRLTKTATALAVGVNVSRFNL